MPKFSAFQDFTAFRFSGKPTHGEAIYRSMRASEIKAFDLTKGSYEESRLYAQAMGLARARYAIERGFNQHDPLRVIELLPEVEKDWSCIPGYNDGIVDRQNALAAKMRLPIGAKKTNVESLMRSIFGEDFIAYRTTVPSEVRTWPNVPWTGPGSWKRETTATLPKFFKLLSPVSTFGNQKVYYEPVQPNDPDRVLNGEVLTLEVENVANAEQVQVDSVGEDSGGYFFTADFIRGHSIGASILFGTIPVWMSNQRLSLIVVKAAAIIDRERIRKANELLETVCRGVSGWAFVQPTIPNASTVGPLTLNVSYFGATTIGTVNIFQNASGIPPTAEPDAEFVVPQSGEVVGGFYFTIYGNALTGTSSVTVGGDSATIVSVTDKTVLCIAPAKPDGVYTVIVTTPGGTSTIKNGLSYGLGTVAVPDRRITESGDVRITESGDVRILEN